MNDNLYQILEIPEDADRATIKKAYFAKIKEFSPDKAPEQFKAIRSAYEKLLKRAPAVKKAGEFHVMTLETTDEGNPVEVLEEVKNPQHSRHEVSINQPFKEVGGSIFIFAQASLGFCSRIRL